MTFQTTFPTIKSGKKKGQLATMNNVAYWFRYQKTDIKNQFKQHLEEWCIPKAERKYRCATVEITIMRNNNRRIDADSAAFASKWIVDTLVQIGWIVDDDAVTFIYKPAVVKKELPQTMLNVKCTFSDNRPIREL